MVFRLRLRELQPLVQPQTHHVNAGVLLAKQRGMADVHPACLERKPITRAPAKPDLGFEQYPAAQPPIAAIDGVGAVRVAIVDDDGNRRPQI